MSSVAMSNTNVSFLPFLYGKIESLPLEMQKEVSLFADFDEPLSDFNEYM